VDQQAILRLNTYRVWSYHRLLGTAQTLTPEQLDQSFEIGHGSLRATLRHLQATQEVWLARLARDRNLHLVDVPAIHDLDELATAWDRCDARWLEYLNHLSPEDLHRVVSGTNSRSIAFRIPVIDCLLHLFTDQAYHSAQANNILRHLGAPVLDLSLAKMCREEHPVECG